MIQDIWISLVSTRKKSKISGEVHLRFGLADPSSPSASREELEATWHKFLSASGHDKGDLQRLMDAPATESAAMGMMRANSDLTDESDLAVHSAEDLDEEVSEVSDLEGATPEKRAVRRGRLVAIRKKVKKPFEFNNQDVLGIVFMEVVSARDLPPERNSTSLTNAHANSSDSHRL